MVEISATCSWPISNDKFLKGAIHVILLESSEDKTDFDLLDVITAESCLNLKKINENDDHLEMTFTAPDQYEIVKICVICEAKHLEIYTHNDEYVCTTDTELIDAEFEDFTAYKSQTIFTKPLGYCKFKYLTLRQSDSMWLYGISFHIQENTSKNVTPPVGGSIGISQIVNKLQEDGLQMSDGAKRLAELFQTRAPSQTGAPPHISMFMKMMNDFKPTVNSLKTLPTEKKFEKPAEKFETGCTNCSKVLNTARSDSSALLQQLIESTTKQMEDRLWEKIKNYLDSQEQRYMEKLDQILTRLPV